MATASTPLSSTVQSVFQSFVDKLADTQSLDAAALEALKLTLMEQKLDHASLREAMFTSGEPSK